MAVARERDPVLAPDKDAPLVRELDDALAKNRGKVTLSAPSVEEIELPHSVFEVLVRVVHEMARGNAVRVMPVHAELTTQAGSRAVERLASFPRRLLEERHSVSQGRSHRRVRLDDLLIYKDERDRERRCALNELASETQKLDLYDE